MALPEEPSPLPLAPQPWTLHGHGWVFALHQPFSKTPLSNPAGSYAPYELETSCDQSACFHGGTGAVMIVRYSDSPVGPYDELIYIPGWFSTPLATNGAENSQDAVSYHQSITRIYVSTAASVMNGRNNWNIPKHRAIFNFTRSPKGSGGDPTLVTVAHPTSPSLPFFRAVLHPTRFAPSFPVATSWIDSWPLRFLTGGLEAALVQPPLPKTSDVVDAQQKAEATGQRIEWLKRSGKTLWVKPSSTGQARLCSLGVDTRERNADWSGFGDGVSFPKFKPALGGRGIALQSFTMQFVEPVEI